jgi:hypothetical protein
MVGVDGREQRSEPESPEADPREGLMVSLAHDVLRLERTLQRRVLRLFQRRHLLDEHTLEDMLTWQDSGGFSLDASVRIHGSDSAGGERLLSTRRRRVAPGRPSRWSACVERRGEAAEERSATASHGEAGIRQVADPDCRVG